MGRRLHDLPEAVGDGQLHWFDLPGQLRDEVVARAFALVRRHERRWLALRITLMLGVLALTAFSLFAAPLPVWTAPLLGAAAGWLLGRCWRIGRISSRWFRGDDFALALALYEPDGWSHRIVTRAMGEWADALTDEAIGGLDPIVLRDRLLLRAGLYDRFERYLTEHGAGREGALVLIVALELADGFPGDIAALVQVACASCGPTRS